MVIYADVDGAKVNRGTIPPDMVVTIQRPDLVIIDNNTSPGSVFLVELIIPFTGNIEAANTRRRLRYEYLTIDIEEAGYRCSNIPLEVARVATLQPGIEKHWFFYICQKFKIRKFQQVIKCCSKLALLGSYTIFNVRSAPDWSGSDYLKP